MNYAYIFAGLVFLFNPCINIVDVLPDFIGCILLFCGLKRLSFLCGDIEDARNSFGKLSVLYAAKTACVAFIAAGDETLMLVFTFSFAVLEMFFLIPAFGRLFAGLTFTATKYDGTAAVKNAASLKSLTNSFIIIRAFMALLPEFTSLSMFDQLGEVTAISVNIHDYKPFFIILAFIVAAITGTLWLVRMLMYFYSIKKDDIYNDGIKNDYVTRILPDTNLFVRRGMRVCLYMFLAFSLSSFDLILDGINYIPDFIAAVFLIIAASVLYRYGVKSKLSVMLPCVYFVVSAAFWGYNVYFTEMYGVANVRYVSEAEDMYNVVTALSAAEAITMALAVLFFLATLTKTLNIHIPRLTGADIHDKNRVDTLTREFQHTCSNYINVITALTVITAITNVLYSILVVNYASVWLINPAVSVVYIIVIIKFISELCESLYIKIAQHI